MPALELAARLFYKVALMFSLKTPRLPRWPFFTGDALLLGCALVAYYHGARPLALREMLLITGCVAAAAVLGILPYLVEFRHAVRLTEVDGLKTALEQINHLEAIGGQISAATSQWQTVQEESKKAAAGAKSIAEHMTRELKDFTAFVERANDKEKATLRLEVDKLRRAEGDWVQVVVRVLDHVFALHQGALRSGQQSVVQQVGRFQNACYDAARRVGLTPFVASENEPFNPERHQPLDDKNKPAAGALITETIASGYTFQGRIVRPALVRLRENGAGAPEDAQSQPAEGAQSQEVRKALTSGREPPMAH